MLRTTAPKLLPGLMGFLLIPTVLAQDLSWRIPSHGVVQYSRTTQEARLGTPSSGKGIERVIAMGKEGGHDWVYVLGTKASPETGWQRPDFDDTYWTGGRSGFGDTKHKDNATRWKTKWIHARTKFDAGRKLPKAIRLSLAHDDGVTVFLNGVQVYQADDNTRQRDVMLGVPALKAMKRGSNTIAVACQNTSGIQYLDLGLTLYAKKQRNAEVGKAAAQRAQNAAGNVFNLVFPVWRPETFVFDTDLAKNRQVLARRPVDVRDIGWHIATDFQRYTGPFTIKRGFPRIQQLGDISVKGKAFPIDDTGLQKITLSFESKAPKADKGEDKRHVEAHVVKHMPYRCRGKIEIERRLDLKQGLLISAKIKLSGMLNKGKGSPEYELRFAEDYELDKLRKHRDGRFQEDVVDAIRKGTAAIKKNLKSLKHNALKPDKKDGDRSYNSGRLALATLAMIQGGIKRDDPVLKGALNALRKRTFVDTYSLAIACMAIESLYAPIGERSDLKSGLISKPRKRQPSPGDLVCLKRWAGKILHNRDTRVDPAYRLRFNYVRGKRYDHSVNQYGLLGLYSAHLCGVEISNAHWQAAINHLLESRQKPRKRIKLELVNHRDFDERIKPTEEGAKRTSSRSGKRSTEVSGWGYYGPRNAQGVGNPIYGSMTCAGITGLTICLAGLRDNGVNYAEAMSEAEKALRGGFGWLAENLSLRWHPGTPSHFFSSIYYYLYGLERACELSGVAMIAGRDWYFEGAMIIMARQRKDGHFQNDWRGGEIIEDTAMAVLFLKKASLPVFTGR